MISLKLFLRILSDVDVLLREGKDFNASGEVLISERDSSDELSISLQFPQTVIREGLLRQVIL